MKENHDVSVCDSKSLRNEEEDRLSFIKGKKMHDLNGSRGGTDPSVFEVNGEDEHRKAKALDDFSKESELELPSETIYEEKMQTGSKVAIRESRKSGSVHITISELYETDEDLYTDKNILECEQSQVPCCSKEAHSHVVKDICIDEGMPANKKNSSVEGSSRSDKNHAGEEKLLAQYASENSFGEDIAKNCDSEDSMKAGEANRGETSKIADDESHLVDRELPVQDFGAPSFLESLLNSIDNEEDKSQQPLDRGLSGNDVSKSHVSSSSVETEPKDDNQQDNNISYNSKVESGSITFDFSYTAPEPATITNEKTNKSEESGKSNDAVGENAENTSDTSPITCTADVCGQDNGIKNSNSKNLSCKSDDDLAAEPHATKHERRKSDDVSSVVGPQRHDEGETSFSAASLVSYSGAVAYSGSLSLRSEGSATSARSFAFPVLQTEWNTSPVRMAKADRRAFRKHKGWRSGLLCCRF